MLSKGMLNVEICSMKALNPPDGSLFEDYQVDI